VGKVSGRVRISILELDHEGYVHKAKRMTKMGHLKPIATKALASLHTTFFCKEISLGNILFEGDAHQVVKIVISK